MQLPLDIAGSQCNAKGGGHEDVARLSFRRCSLRCLSSVQGSV